MTDATRSDYSWSLPNRRFIDSGLYLPSIRSEGIDTVAVIIDTSGSVDADALAAFWTEVREITAELQPESVIVLQVDAALQDAAEYAPGDLPEQIALKGPRRHGLPARLRLARRAGHEAKPLPLLHGHGVRRYPDTAPQFPMIWCDWAEGIGLSPQPPSWGEHIRIRD